MVAVEENCAGQVSAYSYAAFSRRARQSAATMQKWRGAADRTPTNVCVTQKTALYGMSLPKIVVMAGKRR